MFILKSIMLGIGLSMDAVAVSTPCGLACLNLGGSKGDVMGLG